METNPNMTGGKSDFEEITLAIGLLGGVIVVLLYISGYFNNNAIPLDADLQEIVKSFVYILLLEIPIILLFFLFKGISIYAKPKSSEVIKKVTQELFTLSFIYFLLYIIAIISTIFFVYFIYFNIELSNRPFISQLYYPLLLLILVIIGLVLWDYDKFKSILNIPYATKYSFGEFWEINKKLFLLFIVAIILVYIVYLINGLFNLLSLYLLMGSYSIEEFLQPNSENITIGIKETGIISSASYIHLYKMDTNFAQLVDDMRIPYNQINYSRNGLMVGTNNDALGKWYLSINTSKLQTGNYLLHAEVTRLKNPTLGTVKKQTEKLFYIPPKSANYSFNCTQIS